MPFTVSQQKIRKLANNQLEDYRSQNPGTCFADPDFVIDIAAAYELQDAVTKLRVKTGERVIGYKVGCTGPGTKAQFGMAGPIRGTLFSDEALSNGVFINPNKFCELAIEGEMAIKIGGDLEIATVFPVIELHNFLFRAEKKTLSELIANNGFNAGIVLPSDNWQHSKKYIKQEARLTLSMNGSKVGDTGLWPNDAGPEASLSWLKNNLKKSGIELVAGDIVLAGTALGLFPVKAGDEIKVHIDDIPTVTCRISVPPY